GATLAGIGTVHAAVTNAGQVNPGISGPGVLSITGSFTQTAAGTLNLDLGGLTPGTQFDQLNVTGAATLDGTLNVNLTNGYVPAAGDQLTVMIFASGTGKFAALTGATVGGRQSLKPLYDPGDVTLLGVLAGVHVSPTSGLVTTEAGGSATFSVVLAKQPQ